MRITDDQWVDIPEQTASTGAYSLSGGGLDQIATMGPTQGPQQGPVWDQAENAYYDMGASGLYSYDGGNSWEPKRAAPIPQSYSLNSPQLDQIATTYAGPTWVDNGTAGGKYVDQWGNESYDGGNTWWSPGAIAAGAGTPALAPQSWNEPQPIPDTYSLGFNGTAFNGYGDPGAQNPWDTRFDQQPDQGGGFWGGVKDIAGTVGSGAVTALGAAREYVGSPIFGTLSGLSDAPQQPIYDDQGNIIGYKRDPGLLEYPRELGSALKRTFTDPVEQYNRARQGTDEYFANPDNSPIWNAVGTAAIDPLSYAGPGIASKLIPDAVPAAGLIRGLIDQGGGGAVLGGAVGGTFGASDTAEKIPGFGDQPDWLRGLEGGVIGGLAGAGAAGSLKATAAAGSPRLSFTGEVGSASTPGAADDFSTPPLGKGGGEFKTTAYHTTNAEPFTQFDPARVGSTTDEGLLGAGHYLTTDPNANAVIKEANNLQAEVTLKNPLRVEYPRWEADKTTLVNDALGTTGLRGKALTAELTRQGYDGVVLDYSPVGYNHQEIMAINPSSAKFTPPSDTSLNPIRRKIADALDAEAKFRNSGEAEAIKATKRAEQASGLNAVEAGATSAETLANVSAGAKVGKFFDNTPGIKLPEADYNAALTDIVNSTEGFDKIQAVKALDKLQNGERLQPNEIKTLGKLYGPEVEAKIRMTNANRIATVAELTPEDTAQIARQAEIDGKKVATLEVQAKRQHELADELNQRSLMNPTNKQLKTAAEDARARAIKAENDADRILADRAEKATSGFAQKTQDAPRVAETQATGTAKQAEAADRRALRAENKAAINASPEQMVTRAKDVVAKLDVTDDLKSQLIDTIELGARKQSIVLAGMGEDGPGILRKIYASATGEVTDSYTSRLLTQRAFIQNALETQGMSKEAAKQVAKLLQDAELRLKYGANIPEWVTKSLEQAKFDFAEGGAIRGLADISQELKNTQFGIGDMAVFGQQAAKAGLTNAPQIVTGYVNRALQALHLGGLDTAIPEARIARDTQYALDGLALHSHGITDIVTNERTLLSRLGPAGKFLDDKVALPAIKKLTDFQFDFVLGNLRKTIYEGNLVMAHLSGADITNPVVRQRAAEMANAATGAGKLAQRSARANAEKAFLLSPSMRRAQIQQMGQVIKGLSHQDTALSSAMAIASSVGLTLAVGKLLSDYTGIPVQTDLSKKGFGNIRLPDGTVINPFSQEQIAKAFARSIRILAENPKDGKSVAEEWGKILVSSASPAMRPFLASVGVGIDQNGYHWGDMGQGQSFKQRLLNASPIPPLASSIIQNGFSPVRTPLETLGVNAYPESKYDVRDRQSMDMFGVPYDKQTPDQRLQFTDKNGKIPYANPQVRQALDAVTRAQQGADAELATGTFTPAKAQAWRDQYTTNKDNLRFFKDQVYADAGTKPGSDPQLDAYYKVIDQNTAQSGKVNWDAVDAYKKALPDGGKYIDTHSGFLQIDTPTTRAFEKAKDTIETSGFFDKRDKAWAAIQAQLPEAKKYASYDEWYNAKLEAAQKEWAGQATPEYIDKEARKIIDKMAPAKGMKEYGNLWENGWIQANPAAAYLAWKWGYFVPTEEQAKWINNAVGAK